jgi:hypothetical protein
MAARFLLTAGFLTVGVAIGHPWHPMGLSGQAVLSIQAGPDFDSVYAAADDGLYVAGFNDWQKVYDYGSHAGLRACVRVVGHDVYLAWGWGSRSDGLWLRSAYADSWRVLNWLPYSSFVEAGSQGDVIFLGSDTLSAGLWRSGDSGQTWSRCDSGLPQTDVRCLAISRYDSMLLFCGTRTHGLYQSTDGGRFWTAVWPAFADDVRDINFGYGFRTRDSLLMAAVGSNGPRCGIWRSTDRGATWNHDLHVPEATCLTDWDYGEAAAGFLGDSGVYWGMPPWWGPASVGLGNHMVFCLSGGQEVPWAGTADGVWRADWLPGVEESPAVVPARGRSVARGVTLFDVSGRRVPAAKRAGVYFRQEGRQRKLVITR